MNKIWNYQNPVSINFGEGIFEKIHQFIGGRNYALITYPDDQFTSYTRSLIKTSGRPALLINDIAPNPDFELLSVQAKLYSKIKNKPEVIVALGGGSVIDSAKVFSAAENGFDGIIQAVVSGFGQFERHPLFKSAFRIFIYCLGFCFFIVGV